LACVFVIREGNITIYMAYSGKFSPKNPQKYRGDFTNIVYRSTWECRVMTWLDNNDSIIEWGSEELVIPYRSPVDNRVHRYFPDFYVKVKQKDDTIRVMILEVKPARQTRPPEKKKKVTKQYIQEVVTWGVNEAKWKAATEFCLDRGWTFKILTEHDLGLK
jgi:hypothetical protein